MKRWFARMDMTMNQFCYPTRLPLQCQIIGRRARLGLLLLWLVMAPLAVTWQVVMAQESATHTVQPGETLSTIAQNYGIAVDELMTLNGITDPDAIVVGQELLLPAAAQAQPTATPLPRHVVRAGETLSEIAQQYNISLTRLMLFNGIRDANAVYEGQELRIPPPEAAAADDDKAEATATVAATDTPTAAATSTVAAQPDTPTPTVTLVPTVEEQKTEEQKTEEQGAEEQEADTEDETAVARLTSSLNREYVVRSGDTLMQIALRTGVDFDALLALNGIAQEDVGNLAAGQTLILPATGADLQVQSQEREYVVKPGDSLGSIANQFDLTLGDLLSANWIANPDNLTVGEQLTIPGKALDEAEPVQVGPLRRGYYYYTVQAGDTLSTLAKALNTNKLAILEYNGLPDEETVYAGLEIRVPYGPPALPSTRPPVPASGTSFLVSLSRQECWLFHGDRVAYAWNCSTGYGEWITRTGTFAVQSKIENAKSSAYRLDMPYWLGIYNVGNYENGIHGLPVEWDTGKKIWERLVGEPATFGCAMLDDRDAVVLFNMAYIGMPVHIIH